MKNWIVWALFFCGLVNGMALYSQEKTELSDSGFIQFERDLEHLRQQLKIPGMSAAVATQQALVWARGFGYADEKKGIAATPGTPFRIAFLTELFTAALIRQLGKEGALSTDSPIKEYGVMDVETGQLSIRSLLDQNSGQSYRHLNIHRGYLAQVIYRATGQCFADLVITRIIQPLGLDHTAPCSAVPNQDDCKINLERFNELYARQSAVYRMETGGASKPSVYRYGFSDAGGMISTATDMATFGSIADFGTDDRLGWYAQSLGDTMIYWQYGFHPNAVSTLIVNAPARGLTFVILANSDKLSEPFSLHKGNVLNSPAALLFLSRFVLSDTDAPMVDPKKRELGDIIIKSTGEKTLLNHLEQVLILLCSVAFLFTVIFWPLLLIVDIFRKKFRIYYRRRAIIIFLARFSGTVAAFIGLWLIGAIRKLPALLYWHELPGYIHGLPKLQNLTLALPTILVVWSIIPVFFTVYLWKKRYISTSGRLHYTIMTLALLVFILFLFKWHLVGIGYYWNLLLNHL